MSGKHLFQVGVGSGGMVVLDLLGRDERLAKVTIVDPDDYKPHNVARHYFSKEEAGKKKVDLALRWLMGIRPDLHIAAADADILDPDWSAQLDRFIETADLGICAVDSEPAKFHFDALMRKHNKPWTLGEVLSGGIGGWVHLFKPGEACYGCVASHLQREIKTDNSPPPDYSNPREAAIEETRIPASKAAIHAIASLHANLTLDLLSGVDPGFTSILMPLAKVEGVFADAYKPFRFRIARNPECLICGMTEQSLPAGEQLDVALDQALARLGHE